MDAAVQNLTSPPAPPTSKSEEDLQAQIEAQQVISTVSPRHYHHVFLPA